MSVFGAFIWLTFGTMIMMHIVIGQDEKSQEEGKICQNYSCYSETNNLHFLLFSHQVL
jgi:hypothetical protein